MASGLGSLVDFALFLWGFVLTLYGCCWGCIAMDPIAALSSETVQAHISRSGIAAGRVLRTFDQLTGPQRSAWPLLAIDKWWLLRYIVVWWFY